MPAFPAQAVKSIAIYHLPNAANKSYPSTPDVTVSGAFLPMDARAHAYEGGMYVDPHEAYVQHTTDIRVSDKLIIDSETYFVKKVFTAYFGGLRHKRCSISREP